jgi:hypothetical protein
MGTDAVFTNVVYHSDSMDFSGNTEQDLIAAPGAGKRFMPLGVVLGITTAGAAGSTLTLRGKTSTRIVFQIEAGSIKQGDAVLGNRIVFPDDKRVKYVGVALDENEALEAVSSDTDVVSFIQVWGTVGASS